MNTWAIRVCYSSVFRNFKAILIGLVFKVSIQIFSVGFFITGECSGGPGCPTQGRPQSLIHPGISDCVFYNVGKFKRKRKC